MDKFSVATSKDSSTLLLQMAGRLSEEAQLENINLTNADRVAIDLTDLSNISSKGVRTWMMWIQGIDRAKSITLVNCPKVFVNMVNLVQDMVPPHVHIQSIGVPYFCTACGSSFSDTLELSADKLNFNVSENKPCTKCGSAAELDTLPEKYFKFLEERK